MENLWEVTKTAFSGIFNLGTLVGLLTGVFVYGLVCLITIYLENKEFAMRLLAVTQYQLGMLRNKWANIMARWLWTKIINLDYKRMCQLVVRTTNDEEQCLALRNLSQIPGDAAISHVTAVINGILKDRSTSKNASVVAHATLEELKIREELMNREMIEARQ